MQAGFHQRQGAAVSLNYPCVDSKTGVGRRGHPSGNRSTDSRLQVTPAPLQPKNHEFADQSARGPPASARPCAGRRSGPIARARSRQRAGLGWARRGPHAGCGVAARAVRPRSVRGCHQARAVPPPREPFSPRPEQGCDDSRCALLVFIRSFATRAPLADADAEIDRLTGPGALRSSPARPRGPSRAPESMAQQRLLGLDTRRPGAAAAPGGVVRAQSHRARPAHGARPQPRRSATAPPPPHLSPIRALLSGGGCSEPAGGGAPLGELRVLPPPQALSLQIAQSTRASTTPPAHTTLCQQLAQPEILHQNLGINSSTPARPALLTRLPTPTSPPAADAAYESALELSRQQHYSDARQAFEELVRAHPHMCKAWVSYAQVGKLAGVFCRCPV